MSLKTRSIYVTIIFTLTFFTLRDNINGQTLDWTVLGNTWTYSSIGRIDADAPHSLIVDRDTIISGHPAVILTQKDEENYRKYEFESFDTIILRQEGERIYQYLDDTFHVIYDFSVQIGDTVSRYVPQALRTADNLDNYILFRIDSIGLLDIGSRNLKGYFRRYINSPHNVDGALEQGWLYELVGNPQSYLLSYGSFFCDDACPRFLRCLNAEGDGGTSLFYQDFDYPCDTLISSVKTKGVDPLLSISPNPVAEGSSIRVTLIDDLLSPQKTEFYLFDSSGRQVSLSVVYAVDSVLLTPSLGTPSGIYTLILQHAEGVISKRLTIISSK